MSVFIIVMTVIVKMVGAGVTRVLYVTHIFSSDVIFCFTAAKWQDYFFCLSTSVLYFLTARQHSLLCRALY